MRPENKDGPAELWINGLCVGRTRSAIFEQDHQAIKVGDYQYTGVTARRIKLLFGQYDIDIEKLAEAIMAGPKDRPAEQGPKHLPCAESDIIIPEIVVEAEETKPRALSVQTEFHPARFW